MRPFLMLSTRPEDEGVAGERAAVLEFTGLPEAALHQVRVEAAPLPDIHLDDWAGIILGGGPFNASDEHKSPLQRRVEGDLDALLGRVLEQEVPFLGLCYGVGVVTSHLGGLVNRDHGEPVGSVTVSLTAEGRRDPLTGHLPDVFGAFVGHKEAVSRLPDGAVLLGRGEACPVQMFRVGRCCYVTQFHPELDARHLADRILVYREAGYFRPEETDALVGRVRETAPGPEVHSILRRFVELYSDDAGSSHSSR